MVYGFLTLTNAPSATILGLTNGLVLATTTALNVVRRAK